MLHTSIVESSLLIKDPENSVGVLGRNTLSSVCTFELADPIVYIRLRAQMLIQLDLSLLKVLNSVSRDWKGVRYFIESSSGTKLELVLI